MAHQVNLERAERAALGEAAPHAALIDAIDRRLQRAYGWAGVAVLAGCVLVPWAMWRVLGDVSALQVALAASVALLMGLSAAGRWGARRTRALREEVEAYCAREGVRVEVLRQGARRLGERWFFFGVLWRGRKRGRKRPRRRSRGRLDKPGAI